jgi:hypothetical protein
MRNSGRVSPIPIRALLAAVAISALMLSVGSPAQAAKHAPWLKVGSGSAGSYRWWVQMKRPDGTAGEGRLGALRPCLLVGTKWVRGPLEFERSRYRVCTEGDAPLRPNGPPLFGASMQPQTGQATGFTAVGLIVPAGVQRVQAISLSGRVKNVPLRPLTAAEASVAHLGHLRFTAFSARGEWCPDRLITRSATGRILWDSGVDPNLCYPAEASLPWDHDGVE